MESILFKDKILKVKNEKWIKDISQSKIRVIKNIFSIMITDNKRKNIYNK
jgi:uncharacterized protein YlbG (UPF0298 family)